MSTHVPKQSGKKLWHAIVGGTVTALGIIGGIIGIYSFVHGCSFYDVSGQWAINNTMESTSYREFKGLKLGYRIFVTQSGTDITGTGEKWSENDRALPSTAHTHIKLTGSINGKKITATFQEDGTERKTEGTLNWTYQPATGNLIGTFTSTSADSSGPSTGQRVPQQ
jgi:hypothetical protein